MIPVIRLMLLAAATPLTQHPVEMMPVHTGMASSPSALAYLPGRDADARVAAIAFRLVTAGRARCKETHPETGLVLQHLSQFRAADRPGLVAAAHLDRGPGVIAVVPDSPAERAGIRPGDILLTVAGTALPPEPDLAQPFDPDHAHARVDAIVDELASVGAAPFPIALLRDGETLTVSITPVPACPARVLLARSNQRNAFSDGRHVLLTTGLVAQVRSDDELAFVLAHEMAHGILHHAAIMRSDAVVHGLGRTFGKSGRTIRQTEREADMLGGTLMLDAGFDPVSGAAVLTRIGGTDFGIHLFATHDTPAMRIAAMRALVAAPVGP